MIMKTNCSGILQPSSMFLVLVTLNIASSLGDIILILEPITTAFKSQPKPKSTLAEYLKILLGAIVSDQ